MNQAINLFARLGLALDHCLAQVLAQQWLLDLLAAGAGDAAPEPRLHISPRRPLCPTPTRQEKLPC